MLADKPSSEAEELFLAADDDEGRLFAIDQKQSSGSEDLAPILRRALLTGSVPVRNGAVLATPVLEPAEAVDILVGATEDPEADVRLLAVERATVTENPDVRFGVYEEAASSEFGDVRERVFRDIGFLKTKRGIPMLLQGIDDEDPGAQRAATHYLRRDLQMEFQSTAEAERWWAENQHQFDESLQRVGAGG